MMTPLELQHTFPFEEIAQQELTPHIAGWGERKLNFEQLLVNAPLPKSDVISLPGEPVRNQKLWVKELANLSPKYLYCGSRCNQELFDSICKCDTLEKLCFDNIMTATNVKAIKQLELLTHLYMLGSSKLGDLEPVVCLPKIKSLALSGNWNRINSLDFIAKLTNLEGLVLGGADRVKLNTKDIGFLSHLEKLRYLSLYSIQVMKGGLKPISKLKKLEYLYLDFFQLRNWSLQDYILLYENLPNLKCEYIRLAATDRNFQKLHKIT